ncbi:TPA: hypothetical protein ACH3X1_004944 [Trebouxia sp. C0004]
MRLYDQVVCLPRGIASVEFEKAFGYPGKVITSGYLLLAGPYGKYLLEDCFHPEVQVVVFESLDLLGLMWEKTITDSDLKKLERRLPIVLTVMELLLPAWELDLNRHHMIHLVAAIRANGPLQFSELCKACTCCPAYDALWMDFLQAEVGGGVTKRRLPGLLDEWYDWGRCQPQLCQLAQQLCYGPKLSAEVFDRATIQGVPFSKDKD